MVNEILQFVCVTGAIVDCVLGLTFMINYYDHDFTIWNWVKILLFTPVWFLFIPKVLRSKDNWLYFPYFTKKLNYSLKDNTIKTEDKN